MEKFDFKVGDITKIKLSDYNDNFEVGTEVMVIEVDRDSVYYVYKVEVTFDRDSYESTTDWVSADHLEKLSKFEVGNTISCQELLEAVINKEFERGYLIEYTPTFMAPILLEFNGYNFASKNSGKPLILNRNSATGKFKLLGVEEVAHTYRLPDSIAKVFEIDKDDAYLNYFKHKGTYCFHNAVNGDLVQINFTDKEFAKVPDMDGLKQLLIEGEVKHG